MEQFNFWIQAIISILSGILVLTPLVIKLIDYVKISTKEKNWNQMLKLVNKKWIKMRETTGIAETIQLYSLRDSGLTGMFDKGADKKEWVINELKAVASTLNYEIDWNVVSEMIDKICDVSKEINVEVTQ